MPNFKTATITQKGLALMAKVTAGTGNIQFTRAAAGAGTYDAGTDMAALTDLKDERQTFTFSRKAVENSTTVALRIVMTNEDLEEGYSVEEFGLFATDPDEGEILYSIAVAERADYMPADTGSNPVTMTVESYVTVSNAENVTVVMEQGMYALQEDLEALEGRVDANAQALTGKANMSVMIEKTIPTTAWTGDDAPYTAQIAVEGLTGADNELLDVFIQYEATLEQKTAWSEACIISGDNISGALILEAIGEKPGYDLPIYIVKRGDLGAETGGSGGVSPGTITAITENEIEDVFDETFENEEPEEV